jgi:hypothetical protein
MTSQESKLHSRLMGEPHHNLPYEGRPGQTHEEPTHYSCACGAIFSVNVLRAVNVATDRELAEAAVAGSLNHVKCPFCNRHAHVEIAYVLHHPTEERFVLVIPENLRHRELELRAAMLEKLAADNETPVPPYAAEFQVVFGTEGLRASLARPSSHLVLREELAARGAELEERERKLAEVERLQNLRDAQLTEKEQAVEKQEESVMMREERLKERGEKITRMEDDLRSQQARFEALEVRLQMIEQREAELSANEQAFALRQRTLQDREARLRSVEQETAQEGGAPKAGAADGFVQIAPHAPEQDIVTSLMRDPEHDEVPADTTQRSRALAALAGALEAAPARRPDEEAEELSDDDLIEEAEEITADDLIEGEAELPTGQVAALAAAAPAASALASPVVPRGDAALPLLPGIEKAPPVAPPPAGMAHRVPLARPTPAPALAPAATPAPAAADAVAQPPAPEPPPPEPPPPEPPEPSTKPYLEPPAQWVRSGEPTFHKVSGGDVYLYACLDEATAALVKGDTSDLWIQLHLMPTYPLISLTLVLDTTAEELRGLHWLVDIEEDSDRTLLQALRRRFQANVLLFDPKHTLIDEVIFEEPREVNVAQVVDRATQELSEIGPSKVSPVQARTLFHEAWDWAGKKRHPFTEDAYSEIGSVGEAKLALGILTYWSEPKNHEYLVLTKSVPVDLLDTITRRILDGAIRFGLWLPQSLKERSVALALAADLPALVARLIDTCAALGSDAKGLEIAEAAENWQRLLRDADELDVPVSKETLRLAESIIEKGNALQEREEIEVEPADVENLDALPSEDLLPLLERRAVRKKAALVLASRGNAEHLDPLFRAARRMGRPDLVQVIPALLRFGESAGDYFVEGLTARKSFTRQACAIALGELRLRRAVVPLLHQLMAEKTPVWREIARALGRYGSSAVKPLLRYLRNPQGKEDRLVQAMAFFAIYGSVKQVEELASSGDAAVAALASNALGMRDAVRVVDEQLRGAGPLESNDAVLRFGRRLHQAIAGVDQGEGDELLEELGDSDIVEIEEGEEEKA